MDKINIETISFYNSIRRRYFSDLDFNTVIDLPNSRTINTLDFTLLDETPLNKIYIQFRNDIVYQGRGNCHFLNRYLSCNFSKMTQAEFCFLKQIRYFQATIGQNRMVITDPALNDIRGLRNILYQNKPKNINDYQKSLDHGLHLANNIEKQEMAFELKFPVLYQKVCKNTAILDSYFYNIMVDTIDVDYNTGFQKITSLPLSYLDPAFDNDTCLPANTRITLEIHFDNFTFPQYLASMYAGGDFNRRFLITNIQSLKLIYTSYELALDATNNLRRAEKVYITSKRFLYNNIPAIENPSTDRHNSFTNFSYNMSIDTYNELPNVIYFIPYSLTDPTIIKSSNFTYTNDSFVNNGEADAKYQICNNFNNSVVAGLGIDSFELKTDSKEIKIYNNNLSGLNFEETGTGTLFNKIFKQSYNSDTVYYINKQYWLQYLAPTCYTLLLNQNPMNLHTTNYTKFNKQITFSIKFRQNTTTVDGKPISGPWNDPSLLDSQSLLFVHEYYLKFIITHDNNIMRVTNI